MRFFLIAVASFLIIFLGCSTSGPKVEIGGYTFTYGGLEYRIESVTPNYSEGYNIISHRESDRLVFKGIDKEQDGKLDELIVGNMTLDEARKIYDEGILEGERRGYLRKRTFAREYKTSDVIYDYILATYILITGEVYNRLTLVNKQVFQNPTMVIDDDADGQIDRIEKGFESLSRYQSLYREVLDRGIKERRIVRSGKRYLVTMQE
jgi:hypothetical protein